MSWTRLEVMSDRTWMYGMLGMRGRSNHWMCICGSQSWCEGVVQVLERRFYFLPDLDGIVSLMRLRIHWYY